MATANANELVNDTIDEPTSVRWEGLKGLFSTGREYVDADENDLRYERRIWDRRIERFLDASLPDYLKDFGILDEVALYVRDERLADLSGRSHSLIEFAQSLDGDLSVQEERISAIEKAAKKKSSA